MRLVSFRVGAHCSWGAVVGDGVVDLRARLGYPSLLAALQADALPAIFAKIAEVLEADHSLDSIQYLPVIGEPGQIICVGLNYHEHQVETRRDNTSHPTIFARYGRSQVGHGAAILRPPESVMLDYEGELALIIGAHARRISVEDALSVIAGYACYNDASVRDFQRHTTQFHPGKNFPATGAFGPWMVTTDEVPDPSELSIETRLNGSVMQSASLRQLIFPIPELIAYCSTFTELRPGDVIVTGTPGGVGAARKPPVWMKEGDRVEVDIAGVGRLENLVLDEAASPGEALGHERASPDITRGRLNVTPSGDVSCN